jgi:hypothetical protein
LQKTGFVSNLKDARYIWFGVPEVELDSEDLRRYFFSIRSQRQNKTGTFRTKRILQALEAWAARKEEL